MWSPIECVGRPRHQSAFLIATFFTASLARLTGGEQEAVKTTAFDLQLYPANPRTQIHRLDWAREKSFWSVRVRSDLRLIVHRNPVEPPPQIDWGAVVARDFRDPSIKEAKQAEFLLHGFARWTLVRRIGVISASMRERVALQLTGAGHEPAVEVMRAWYF